MNQLIKRFLLLTISACFLTDCGKSKIDSTYEMVIDNKSESLPVHNDAILIQDDMMVRLKPIWENLESGHSVTFYYSRTFDVEPAKEIREEAEKKLGEDIVISSTVSRMSPELRFFKNRNGRNGLESVDAKGQSQELFHGNYQDWNTMEESLRHYSSFSERMIRSTLYDE